MKQLLQIFCAIALSCGSCSFLQAQAVGLEKVRVVREGSNEVVVLDWKPGLSLAEAVMSIVWEGSVTAFP